MTTSLLVFLLWVSGSVTASPLSRRSSDTKPSVWVPILVVGAFLVVLCIAAWSRRSWRRGFAQMASGAAISTGAAFPTGATTEITADQLAGPGSPTSPSPNNNVSDNARSRRTRRNRRTPSQISTHSLPEYQKEAGDQELVVVFRDPDNALIMESVDENNDSPRNANTRYEVPLPQNSDEPSPGNVRFNDTPSPDDPRGDAPAYLESNRNDATEPNIVRRSIEQEAPSNTTRATNRRSGIRNLFGSLGRNNNAIPREASTNGNQPQTPPPEQRTRQTLDGSSPPETPQRRHRPSQSGSASLLSLTPFRTISRQRSSNTLNSNHNRSSQNLTSPSLISLNSISSPLSHTLTRTEFIYPESGPTPEQVKLISSRESLALFGKPYGADAIAYAASSRQDLVPPPDFEESMTEQASSSAAPQHSPSSSADSGNTYNRIVGGEVVEEPAQVTTNGSHHQEDSAPPSSFRLNIAAQRPESRASTTTVDTFETADESVAESGAFYTGPPTPTPQEHRLEPTDTTVRPNTTTTTT